MQMKLTILFIACFLCLHGCAGAASPSNNQTIRVNAADEQPSAASGEETIFNSIADLKNTDYSESSAMSNLQTDQPKTVRDFFMRLPEKYFLLEGCIPARDKDCRKAKIDYLKTFAEVEDTKNGYLKGGCDGAQSCLEMALFKRSGDSYIVGLAVFQEMMNDFYYLEYKNGVWTDVSAQIVPQFSKKNMYELPRYGTTVKVFAKKILETGDNYEISEKGAKLYDLEWKNGKFTVKK